MGTNEAYDEAIMENVAHALVSADLVRACYRLAEDILDGLQSGDLPDGSAAQNFACFAAAWQLQALRTEFDEFLEFAERTEQTEPCPPLSRSPQTLSGMADVLRFAGKAWAWRDNSSSWSPCEFGTISHPLLFTQRLAQLNSA